MADDLGIKQALNMVKRGQADIQYHAALMDAYAEHLNVLEMMLIAAAGTATQRGGSKPERRDEGTETQDRSGSKPGRRDSAWQQVRDLGDLLKRSMLARILGRHTLAADEPCSK